MEALLDNGGTLVLDGASGTLLEQQGIRLHPVLWSAEVIRSNEKAVKDLHRQYFDAGANIATTLTYQASIAGYKEELGLSDSESFLLMTRAVMLAKEAAVEARYPLLRLVAAGLGPYGAYLHQGEEYTGNYGEKTTEETLRQFHAPRIAAVLAGDPDILLFETIPNKLELKVITDIMNGISTDVPVWIALSLKISSEGVQLADGTPIDALKPLLSPTAAAIGANCYPIGETEKVLTSLKPLGQPLIVYPNSGETYDGVDKTWKPTSENVEWSIDQWIESGARVIGGCCRTSPQDISLIAKGVRDNMQAHAPQRRSDTAARHS